MKRVNLFLIAAFVAASAMLVSCSDDEKEGPSIQLKVAGKFYNDGDRIEDQEAGATLAVEVIFKGGDNRLSAVSASADLAGSKFDYVDIEGLNEGVIKRGEKEIKETFTITVPIHPQTLVVTFTATDTQKEPASVELKLTVKAKETEPDGPTVVGDWQFTIGNPLTFGAQSNASTGSFYNVVGKSVLLKAAADGAPASVDFIYFYGATNKATFAAPDFDDVKQVFASVGNWSTKNATRFKKLPTSAKSSEPDADWWEDAVTENRANDLTAGQLVVFQTASTRTNSQGEPIQGVFEVVSINGTNSSGSITIRFIEREWVKEE